MRRHSVHADGRVAVRMDVRIGLMLKRLLRTLPRLFPLASGTRARLAPVGTMRPAGVRAARIHATFQRQGSAAALAGLASLIVKIHPQAGGSGLPEVKETLVGVLGSNPNPRPEMLALTLTLAPQRFPQPGGHRAFRLLLSEDARA